MTSALTKRARTAVQANAALAAWHLALAHPGVSADRRLELGDAALRWLRRLWKGALERGDLRAFEQATEAVLAVIRTLDEIAGGRHG